MVILRHVKEKEKRERKRRRKRRRRNKARGHKITSKRDLKEILF